MIDEVKKAVEQIEKLPPEQQLEIVRLIQDELGWDETFQNSQEQLSTLAEEALRDHQDGKTSKRHW